MWFQMYMYCLSIFDWHVNVVKSWKVGKFESFAKSIWQMKKLVNTLGTILFGLGAVFNSANIIFMKVV